MKKNARKEGINYHDKFIYRHIQDFFAEQFLFHALSHPNFFSFNNKKLEPPVQNLNWNVGNK